VGWNLYLYAANTSSPVNSYVDTGLTILNPWPLVADSYGMIGQFWLPDGNYRARATSNDGSIIYFDQNNIAALGPSSTTVISGAVDPTSIFQTGMSIWGDTTVALPGWVRDNGSTLGSATSGAMERANPDCQNLFIWLWNNYQQGGVPLTLSPPRGASASADWTANKKIFLPDKRGLLVGGLDDMGNTAAGRYSGVPVAWGSGYTTPGNLVGEQAHLLTAAEIPAHTHSGMTGGQTADHTHPYNPPTTAGTGLIGSTGPGGLNIGSGNTGGTSNDHQHSFTTDGGTGGGGYHNNTPYTILGTFYRKL
jgi:hypothetical protein